MFELNWKEAVEVLVILKLVINIWGVDWIEAAKPEWNKEKMAKAVELIIEAAIFILELIAKMVT